MNDTDSEMCLVVGTTLSACLSVVLGPFLGRKTVRNLSLNVVQCDVHVDVCLFDVVWFHYEWFCVTGWFK